MHLTVVLMLAVGLLVCVFIVMLNSDVVSTRVEPRYIRSFCQAQHDVYEVPYDSCIALYNKHHS
jgi:hypothetical protein